MSSMLQNRKSADRVHTSGKKRLADEAFQPTNRPVKAERPALDRGPTPKELTPGQGGKVLWTIPPICREKGKNQEKGKDPEKEPITSLRLAIDAASNNPTMQNLSGRVHSFVTRGPSDNSPLAKTEAEVKEIMLPDLVSHIGKMQDQARQTVRQLLRDLDYPLCLLVDQLNLMGLQGQLQTLWTDYKKMTPPLAHFHVKTKLVHETAPRVLMVAQQVEHLARRYGLEVPLCLPYTMDAVEAAVLVLEQTLVSKPMFVEDPKTGQQEMVRTYWSYNPKDCVPKYVPVWIKLSKFDLEQLSPMLRTVPLIQQELIRPGGNMHRVFNNCEKEQAWERARKRWQTTRLAALNSKKEERVAILRQEDERFHAIQVFGSGILAFPHNHSQQGKYRITVPFANQEYQLTTFDSGHTDYHPKPYRVASPLNVLEIGAVHIPMRKETVESVSGRIQSTCKVDTFAAYVKAREADVHMPAPEWHELMAHARR